MIGNVPHENQNNRESRKENEIEEEKQPPIEDTDSFSLLVKLADESKKKASNKEKRFGRKEDRGILNFIYSK